MKIFFLFLFILLFSNIINAKNIKFTEYTLSNGLHVILHQDKIKPVVCISILYHVGSKNDFKSKSGMAHFFEHLMFQGSKKIKRGEFMKYVSFNGGQAGANTGFDETVYYEILPANSSLELAFWLESDRMQNLIIDNKSIKVQKSVIEEENKLLSCNNDSYRNILSRVIPRLLFKKHTYKYPIIGTLKTLNNIKKNDFVKFYKTYYIPNNAVLCVAGNFNINKVKKLINLYFSSIPKGKKNPYINITKNYNLINKEVFYIYKDSKINESSVFLIYTAPKRSDKDSRIFKILEYLLVKDDNSLLIKNLIYKNNLANYVDCVYNNLEDYGVFIIYATANKGVTLSKLTRAIDLEINNLKKTYISQYALNKQINVIEKNFFNKTVACVINIARAISSYYVYCKNSNMINEDLILYNKITPKYIKNILIKYLNNSRRIKIYHISN